MSSKNEAVAKARRAAYVPAAGCDLFLPLYDPIVKLLGGDRARKQLVDQAAIRTGNRVLEVGCGTGSLLFTIKYAHPDVEVVGLDPDPKALTRAVKLGGAVSYAAVSEIGSYVNRTTRPLSHLTRAAPATQARLRRASRPSSSRT